MEQDFHILFFRAFHARRNYLGPSLKELGFGSGQPKLADYLDRFGPCTQRELSDYYEVDPAAVSRMLTGLEKRGYVSRRVNGANRRRDLVEITPPGREAVARWRTRCREAEEVMLRGFTAEERARFADYLSRAYQNFRRVRGGEPPCGT